MRLKFRIKRVTADLELRYPIIMLDEKIGRGKAILLSLLKLFLKSGKLQGFSAVRIMNAHARTEEYALMQTPDRNLIIIDNFDYLMYRDEDVLYDAIMSNSQNYYILIGNYLPFIPTPFIQVPDDGFAELTFDKDSKTLSLVYRNESLSSDGFQPAQIC